MKHPYAKILQAIIEGKEIQFRNYDGEWITQPAVLSIREIADEMYAPERYRVKPKTVRIGECDVPEPMQEAPEEGSDYYVPSLIEEGGYECYTWDNHTFDMCQLENCVAHSTEEAASLHCKALILLTKRK